MDERILSRVGRFLAGERNALDEVAEELGRHAYRLALGSVGDPVVAEDIAQEALLRLYARGDEIEKAGSFPVWFYRVVLNLVHDHYRRTAREEEATEKFLELRRSELKGWTEPMAEDERLKLREALRAAIASLDEKHREAFLLKEVEGKSHAEIAQLLKIPEGTVWSRLSYARKYLREKLLRAGYGE